MPSGLPSALICGLDDDDVVDAPLAQHRSSGEAGEPATDDGHLDLVGSGWPIDGRDIGIVEEAGEAAGGLDVLLVAVGSEPLVTLGGVAPTERFVVDVDRYLCHRASSGSRGSLILPILP